NVNLICRSDKGRDELKYDDEIKEEKDFKSVVLGGFRGDDVLKVGEKGFSDLIEKLEGLRDKIDNGCEFVDGLNEGIE
ncbi:glucuronate isomerase, partial [Staphylococcus pasteuri]|uniref:glucuronate isomerase n=1 Tax=Staphylococcus pasteuri TaxID=45972 RepID=UPI0012B873B4